jgi:hypothetical protein
MLQRMGMQARVSKKVGMIAVALSLAAGSSVWLGAQTEAPAHVIAMPDGGSYSVTAMPFERPHLRQAGGQEKAWQEAGVAYQSGQYRTSERLFDLIENATADSTEQHEAALFRGVSLLMLGRHKEAETVLTRASKIAEETGLGGTADSFYLGLTALAKGDSTAAAKALLQATAGPFSQEARALLGRLKAP